LGITITNAMIVVLPGIWLDNLSEHKQSSLFTSLPEPLVLRNNMRG
jgi:hypothetical protein